MRRAQKSLRSLISLRSGVGAATKVVRESGAESLDGAAKRTAKEIAKVMVAGYKRRGWL